MSAAWRWGPALPEPWRSPALVTQPLRIPPLKDPRAHIVDIPSLGYMQFAFARLVKENEPCNAMGPRQSWLQRVIAAACCNTQARLWGCIGPGQRLCVPGPRMVKNRVGGHANGPEEVPCFDQPQPGIACRSVRICLSRSNQNPKSLLSGLDNSC